MQAKLVNNKLHKMLAVDEDAKGWLTFNVFTLMNGKMIVHYNGTNMKKVREHRIGQVLVDPSISKKNHRILEGLLLDNLDS